MSIKNQIIRASGNKVECLVLAENTIQLMSKVFNSLDEFNEAWNKTLTLATKSEIKYDAIKSISKEEGEDEVLIKYKGLAGMTSEEKLTFPKSSDRDAFYDFFQTEKGFVRTDETMSPLKSVMPYLGGLGVTLLATAYGYYQSVEMANGQFIMEDGYSRAARRRNFIDSIIGMLGTNGVLLLGLGISVYIGYLIWNRYKNPPVHTLLIPKS
jgi:hypothetical protein